MKFIEHLEKVESILLKYDSSVGELARDLAIKNAIQSSRRVKEYLTDIEKENRLLRIGIVGSVNAGKSTLINALLFKGEPVIPKAATPMTAALTEIKHGDDLRLDINYYSETDLQEIEENHILYKEKYNNEYGQWLKKLKERYRRKQGYLLEEAKISDDELEEIKKDAADKARRAMKKQVVIAAAYEQYESFKSSSVDIDSLRANVNSYSLKDLNELNSFLMKHVGNGGEYMPFTKSVSITINDPFLEDIIIIDTPGINDPVQSREHRTRELLKQCDALLVLSPASQFMTEEDLVLLDRIASKEGVKELFVVGTKTDNALASHLCEKHNGNLYAALDELQTELLEHLGRTISKFWDEHKEVGNVFLQLIDSRDERVSLTAGVCSTIIRELEKDPGGYTSFAWKNLQMYKEYFDPENIEVSVSSLKRLLNIESIRGVIQSTRDKKDELLAEKTDSFTKQQERNLDRYLVEICDNLSGQISNLNETNVEELKMKQNHMKEALDRVTIEIDDEYDMIVRKLSRNVEREALQHARNLRNLAEVSATNAQTETTTTRTKRKKILFIKCGTKSEEVPTNGIMTGQAVNAVENYTNEAEVKIRHSIEELLDDWRSNTPRLLTDKITSLIEARYLDIYAVRRSIYNVVMNRIKEPSFSFEIVLPAELRPRGLLKGSEANAFLSGIHSFLHILERRYIDSIRDYRNIVYNQLKVVNVAKEITGKYIAELDKLTTELASKEKITQAYANCREELGGMIAK